MRRQLRPPFIQFKVWSWDCHLDHLAMLAAGLRHYAALWAENEWWVTEDLEGFLNGESGVSTLGAGMGGSQDMPGKAPWGPGSQAPLPHLPQVWREEGECPPSGEPPSPTALGK